MVFDISKRFNRRAVFFVTLIIISFCPVFFFAQDSLNVRFVGGYPFGSATGGVVSGEINGCDYIVVSSGSGILIFDVDDPANPVKVGQILSPIEALVPFLDDTLLYVAAQKQGLRIYNVANPSNPLLINSWQPNDSIVHVCVYENSAYVVSYTRMVILDVSDPTSLVVQGIWAPDSVLSYYVYVKDNYAYVCAACAMGMNDALIIVDVSDQALPYELGRCYIGQYMEVVVKGNFAYVTGWALAVVDISDPCSPHVVTGHLVQFPVGNPQLSGNYLYVAGMFLYVFDITVPDDPVIVAHPPYPASCMTILGDHLYGMGYGNIYVIDITEPLLPYQVSVYEIMRRANRVQVSGDMAIFGDQNNIFRIIDVTDPQNCYELGKYILNFPPGFMFDFTYEFTMSEDYLYVAACDSGMRVVNIADPTNPYEVGHCYVPGLPPYYSHVRSVCIQGSYAYLGCSGSSGAGGYTFAVCDISDPSASLFVGGIPYHDSLQICDVAVVGNYAYCSANQGLRIVDISDPSDPNNISGCNFPTYATFIFVSGNYAYLCGGYDDATFWIVDISNPYNPVLVGYHSPIRVNAIYVQGDYAYLSDDHYGGGVRIFDVSDPANPYEVGYYRNTIGNGVFHTGVYVSNGYIYTTASFCGLWILEPYGIGIEENRSVPLMSRLRLSSIGRNFELTYSLEKSSAVTISLFDVCGRVVDKIESRVGPGMHQVRLQTASASGVYFVRIETDEWVETKKIVLIR